jgi:hypothetical protein
LVSAAAIGPGCLTRNREAQFRTGPVAARTSSDNHTWTTATCKTPQEQGS